MWHIYTVEYYSAVKKKKPEIIKFAGEWMEQKKFIPSEVTLAQKGKCHLFSLICGC